MDQVKFVEDSLTWSILEYFVPDSRKNENMILFYQSRNIAIELQINPFLPNATFP